MMVSSTQLDPMAVVLENGLIFFFISSLRAGFLNFGMASPYFCLRLAVCGLRFAVPLRGVEHETTNPRTNL